MTRVTLVFGLFGLRLFRRRGNPLWLWACVAAVWIVGYSRVYLGQHWPVDVAGGILLGGIGLALTLWFSPRGFVGPLDGERGREPAR
jgi:membrane-associated phospholipid phosphatase